MDKRAEEEYKDFFGHIRQVAHALLEDIKKGKEMIIVAHHDVDGLIASFIFSQAINDKLDNTVFFFTDNLLDDTLSRIKEMKEKVVIFFDIGALREAKLERALKDKEWYIVDHHPTDYNNEDRKNIINPYLFGIDGSKSVCGATLSYLLSLLISKKTRYYAALSLVGAIADSQLDHNGFKGINRMIEKIAEKGQQLEVKKDIALFATSVRPLYKSIAYLLDKERIGDAKAIEILKLALPPQKLKRVKEIKIDELTEEEKKKIKEAIIYLYSSTPSEEIIEKKYIIKSNLYIKEEYEMKELATLLNAMCRLREYGKALHFLYEGIRDNREVYLKYAIYREIINKAMSRVKRKKIKKNYLVILPSTLDIPSSIIGVICNLLANKYEHDYIVVGLSKEEDKIKFSVRVGKKIRGKIDIGDVIRTLCNEESNLCAGSGHKDAAGGYVLGNEEKFLDKLDILTSRYLNI